MTQANFEYRGNFGDVDGEETVNNTRIDLNGRLFLTRKLWDVGNTAPYGHRGFAGSRAETAEPL